MNNLSLINNEALQYECPVSGEINEVWFGYVNNEPVAVIFPEDDVHPVAFIPRSVLYAAHESGWDKGDG